MNTKLIAILFVAAASFGALSTQIAFGQSVQIAEGLELSTNQVIYILIIGAFAGIIRAWQGYDKSPNDFDLLYFVNGVRDSILVSIPIAFAAALTLPELNPVGYVMIFFTVFGGASFAATQKKKSIPSNATPEEIEKILESRN